MAYCKNCGNYVPYGKICSCGSDPNLTNNTLNGQPSGGGLQSYQPSPYQYRTSLTQKKSNAWVLAIIISVILLIAIAAAVLVPVFTGPNSRAKQSDMNSYAERLRKTADHALEELRAKDEYLGGLYIISSETEDNVAVPFDAGDFNQSMEEYFHQLKDMSYFIVVKNGYVEYAAISNSWTDKNAAVGSYPLSKNSPIRYQSSARKNIIKRSDTLDIIYWDAYDKIFAE